MKNRLILSALLLLFMAGSTFGQDEETLSVGDKAPDFEAKTFDDGTVTLSERFGEEGKPVILLFSRANW